MQRASKADQSWQWEFFMPVVIASFEEELLCPMACLRVYEKATAKFREDEAAMQLFLAVVPPHQPVSSSAIVQWIKKSLERAGLEPTFSPHSTRSAASTAAALSGLSTHAGGHGQSGLVQFGQLLQILFQTTVRILYCQKIW